MFDTRMISLVSDVLPDGVFAARSARGHLRGEREGRNESEMLKEGVHRHETRLAFHGPEIVRGEHCYCRENTQRPGSQPDQAAPDQEQRAAKLDDDGYDRPRPRG